MLVGDGVLDVPFSHVSQRAVGVASPYRFYFGALFHFALSSHQESRPVMAILSKMLVLVLIMLIGFCAARLGITNAEFNRRVTPVLMNVFLIATILNSVFSVDVFVGGVVLAQYFGAITAMFIISMAIAWAASWALRIRQEDRGVFRLMVLLSNNVFIGFPVVEAMFGPEAVFYAAISNIPFNLILYTLGVTQIQQGERPTWNRILTPPLIATLLAGVLYLAQFRAPALLADIASTLGAATMPVSMMIIGTSLGIMPLKNTLTDWRVYAAAFLRLILVPLVVWVILHFFIRDPMMLGIPVMLSACPSAMIIAPICLQYGKDDSFASKIIFVSTVLSAVTLPMVASILF